MLLDLHVHKNTKSAQWSCSSLLRKPVCASAKTLIIRINPPGVKGSESLQLYMWPHRLHAKSYLMDVSALSHSCVLIAHLHYAALTFSASL